MLFCCRGVRVRTLSRTFNRQVLTWLEVLQLKGRGVGSTASQDFCLGCDIEEGEF